MSKEWKKVQIKDIINLVVDNRGKNPKSYSDKGIPVIDNYLITSEWRINLKKVKRYIDEETYQNFIRKYIQNEDVLMTLVGNGYGNVGLTPQIKCVIIQNTIGLRSNNNNYNKFLYYLLKNNRRVLKNLNIGAAQPSIKVGDILDLFFTIPPLQEQKAIAHVLGTLDDKIELNRKMNETLEAMAQAMFKSWFVDFDPVLDNALAQGNAIPDALQAKAERRKAVLASGKYKALPVDIQGLFPASFVYNEELGKWIPNGWEVSKLKALVNVKYGKDHKKLNEGKYPCYGSGGVMRFVEKALCESESVLIPRKGSLNNMLYVRQPFWSVDTMFFTLFKRQNMVKFIFYYLKKFNFAEMNVGSAVPSMTTKVLNNINIITPCENVLESFEKQIELLATRKDSNTKYNEKLTLTRDLLLSQLISGKTRLPESFVQQF